MKRIFIIVTAAIITSGLLNAQTEDLTDPRDGKIYKTVKVSDQVWMAENLNFEAEKSFCYGGKSQNCEKYGRLYSWEIAKDVCPNGWHLPSDEEWAEVERFLGMTDVEIEKVDLWRGTDQGEKLLTDKNLGFNILLGGYRNPPSNYFLEGMQAFFWTSTEKAGHAWFRQFMTGYKQIYRNSKSKDWGMSVRCVKDE